MAYMRAKRLKFWLELRIARKAVDKNKYLYAC
jgi:hypothetical protein